MLWGIRYSSTVLDFSKAVSSCVIKNTSVRCVCSFRHRSTEPGENLKDDLLQIYARLTMFNMAVRLLKCLSYLHNNCTFIIKVLIITTNEDDDLAIGRSDMVGDGHYYM